MTLGPVRAWARMVKFSHSLFALPFAFSGAALAAAEHGLSPLQAIWILLAMVGARNAAMGFNRLVDQGYDARNPRTAARELPRGYLSRGAVWAFTLLLTGLFVLASFQLNPLCGRFSPLALFVLFGYSLTKRFTWASHFVLGLALGLAPVGGWLAVAGEFSSLAWLLAGAVLLWVAGFDVIYACQDVDFDRGEGLHSIPARFGIGGALMISRLLHALALGALVGVGLHGDLHPVYWAGLAIIAAILVWEHRLVRADDLSRLGVAFFNMNGVISVIYFVTVVAALLLPRAGV